MRDTARCPCLSGNSYGDCCAPFHRGEAQAPTAERLMRSRYSAFATLDAAYLLRTWHPSTRPGSLDLDESIRWFRLDIDGITDGGPFDGQGTVEFTAHYRTADGAEKQHEVSRFVRERGEWYYVDGAEAMSLNSPRAVAVLDRAICGGGFLEGRPRPPASAALQLTRPGPPPPAAN